MSTTINLNIQNEQELFSENKKLDNKYALIIADPIKLVSDLNVLDLIKLKNCPFGGIFINNKIKNALLENDVHGFGLESETVYFRYGIKKIKTI